MTTINEISNHIMSYFDGTLDAFGYTAQSVNEISNPDESYMGTLNLQFRDYPIDDDEKAETLPGHLKRICSVDKISLANFLNDDQGYESGISMYGHYIACKCLDISSEREYMNQYTDIRILTNELEPC